MFIRYLLGFCLLGLTYLPGLVRGSRSWDAIAAENLALREALERLIADLEVGGDTAQDVARAKEVMWGGSDV